jgi:hypothetical protein
MDYEKRYPFARNQNEFVTLTWETGYRNVQIWFRDRLVATIENPASIKKGVKITDEELNVIELTFSEKPMAIDVVIDGFHSPVNFSHPSKVLKLSARTLWYIFGLAVIGTLINAGTSRLMMPANQIQFLFDVVFTVAYLIAAINTGKSKTWGYFLGMSVFTFSTIIYIAAIVLLGGLSVVTFISILLRISFVIYLMLYIRIAINARKHEKYATAVNADLLDN